MDWLLLNLMHWFKMRKLHICQLLIIGILTFPLCAQPAKDCTKNRTIQINNRTLFLNKGEVYDTLQFIGWLDVTMRFLKARDTIDFLSGEGDIFGEQAYGENSAADQRSESPGSIFQLKKDTFYKVIYVCNLYFDTVISRSDYYLAYKSIHSICNLNDTFHSAIRNSSFEEPETKDCRCYADSSMYGVFKDFETGEELKIEKDLSVRYKSIRNPKWVKLSSQETHEPGFLKLWFPATPNEKYELFYTGDTWLIPGVGGKFGWGPQFFKLFVSN